MQAGPTYRTPGRVGVFGGPWDTGWPARDGAVIGFEDVFLEFSVAAEAGEFNLVTAGIEIFRDYQRIKEFLATCQVVYANCGPWAALLYVVREREKLNVRIIREVRTIGWVGYIWQEEVANRLERPGDLRVFPSRYARDIWVAAMPGTSQTTVYYPLLRNTSGPRRTPGRPTTDTVPSRTAGFFSVLSRDKGFATLPEVISRMHDGGHRIDRLLLAGRQADPDLYASVVNGLSDIGVDVDYRGGLPHAEIRNLMAVCDCVLFLTTSSIESLGRVMVEASALGVPVVTADFGAALDLVRAEYRIPVDYPAHAAGACDVSFPLAQLVLERWSPPSVLSAEACYLPAIDEYMAGSQPTPNILHSSRAEPPVSLRPLRFSFHCEVDSLELADKLLVQSELLCGTPIHELVDLGGALKNYLLANGYNPQVRFTPRRDNNPPSTPQTVTRG